MSIKIDANSMVNPKFIDVPFKYGGSKLDGADCVGIALLWLNDNGVKVSYNDFTRDIQENGKVLEHWFKKKPSQTLEIIKKHGSLISFQELRKFDLILLYAHASVSRYPTGLGVMVDNRHYLSSELDNKSFVRILDTEVKNRCFGGMRLNKAIDRTD
jgi:hypothetical protein